MRSSTSSSEPTSSGVALEPVAEAVELPAGRSTTAPGNSYWVQPLPERRVPAIAWRTAAMIAVTLLVVALGAWEWRMRTLGLEVGDFGPTRGAWAIERRRVDAGNVRVAIVGSSRVLFGTDLDEFERVAGVRPVQLALQGSSTRTFVADLAADPDFTGLLIVDGSPLNYFRAGRGPFDDALEYYHDQTLSQRSDHWLDQRLQRHLAYMDGDYRLMKLIERELQLPEREGVRGPYGGPWKVATTHEQRQTYLWGRVQRDERLRSHAVAVWIGAMTRVPTPTTEDIDAVIAATRRDVEAIRARGGDVLFVRPPSSGRLARLEAEKFPRDQVWDRLLTQARVRGFHFAGHDATRTLTCIEDSHLSRDDARTFTRAYAEFVRDVLQAPR